MVVFFVVLSLIIVLSRPLFTICKRGSSCRAVKKACYNKQLAEKRQVHLWILFIENSFKGQFMRDKQNSHFVMLDFCGCHVIKWQVSECANNSSCFQLHT